MTTDYVVPTFPHILEYDFRSLNHILYVSPVYVLISKLVPHPQLLVASGLSTILN